MRKTGFIFLLILLLHTVAFGQRGDTRTNGMANAFTALADDANALFFNPAGLVFLKKPYINWGLDYISNEASIPWDKRFCYPSYALLPGTDYYQYTDPITHEIRIFDPAVYGFPYTPGNMDEYYAACAAYTTWKDFYSNSSVLAEATEYLTLSRLLCADKNWGFAFLNNASKGFNQVPLEDFLSGAPLKYSHTVLRDVGIVVGYGFEWDALAVGVNLKLFQEKSDFFTLESVGWGWGIFSQYLFPTIIGTMEEKLIGLRMEWGAGALLPLDFITLGIYIDKIVKMRIDGITNQFQLDLTGIYETLNLGFSLSPFNRKRSDARSFLNLNINGDLRNIGSNFHRTACLGVEAGINLSDLLVINVRGGIFSRIGLDPENLINLFSFDDDVFSYGGGIKILFLQLNFAFESPVYILSKMFTEEYDQSMPDFISKFYFNIEFAY